MYFDRFRFIYTKCYAITAKCNLVFKEEIGKGFILDMPSRFSLFIYFEHYWMMDKNISCWGSIYLLWKRFFSASIRFFLFQLSFNLIVNNLTVPCTLCTIEKNNYFFYFCFRMRIFLKLLACIQMCRAADILMMTLGGTKSHKIPFLELAKGLIPR